MEKRATVILFDVDGTLITCGGAGRRAMRAAFRETVGDERACDFPFAGSTDRAIARQGLRAGGVAVDDAAIEGLLERYLAHLGPALEASPGYAVLPGVVRLMDALANCEGIAVGLGTGNVEAGARAKLRPGGISERFGFGGFGCDHERRERLIAAGAARGAARLGRGVEDCRVVVVGDTPLDVAAARANGADCVGVATGPYAAEVLLEAGAMAAFADLTDPRALPMLLA